MTTINWLIYMLLGTLNFFGALYILVVTLCSINKMAIDSNYLVRSIYCFLAISAAHICFNYTVFNVHQVLLVIGNAYFLHTMRIRVKARDATQNHWSHQRGV